MIFFKWINAMAYRLSLQYDIYLQAHVHSNKMAHRKAAILEKVENFYSYS